MVYLLTLLTSSTVLNKFKHRGFYEPADCLEGTFICDSLPIQAGDIEVLDMLAPARVADSRAGAHLSIAYACDKNELELPSTRVYVVNSVLCRLLNQQGNFATVVFREIQPYAVYDPDPSMNFDFNCNRFDHELLRKINDYRVF